MEERVRERLHPVGRVNALVEHNLNEEEYAPQLSLLNRFGQGREIAEASLRLASDASSYVRAPQSTPTLDTPHVRPKRFPACGIVGAACGPVVGFVEYYSHS